MVETISKQEELYERRKKFVPSALGIFTPNSASHAKGASIWNVDGREMIDFAGGIGVINAGHCPEPVVRAIQEQAAKLIHSCFNVAIYEEYLDLAEKLVELFPHDENTKVMLTNSGAESVENAIKIARQATGRSAIICYTGGFHGRTMMSMSLTSKVAYKAGCGPFVPEVYRIPFPYYNATLQKISEDEFVEQELQALHQYFNSVVAANDVAAIIIEPVQGEGGFYVAPKKYLQGLRQICDEKGIMLILDEVQTGFGRTGKWAAYEHYDIVPDISTWAKSMGSGMPIGCVIAKGSVFDKVAPSTIGGTYPGNPVCVAASLATLNYMEDININALGRKVGKIVKQRFDAMKIRFPEHISEVRGLGAMLAIELSHEGDIQRPNPTLTKKIVNYAAENGLIVLSAGMNGNVIRTLSPLVIEEEALHRGLDIIEEAIAIFG